MAKQYYFIKFQKNGRTYFKNQDGQRVAKAKVESGRRKILLELGQKIGDNFKKGDLISLKDFRTQVKAQKPPKVPKVSTFNVMNVNLQKEISNALKANKKIYIQKDGKTYQLKSKKSIAALQLFTQQINSSFYKTIGKKTDSPLFNIQISLA
jgi:hypothetical protein